MDEFKPCPFCNSEEVDYYFEFGNPDKDGFWVRGQVCCKDCGARGSQTLDTGNTRQDAITAWNNRSNR